MKSSSITILPNFDLLHSPPIKLDDYEEEDDDEEYGEIIDKQLDVRESKNMITTTIDDDSRRLSARIHERIEQMHDEFIGRLARVRRGKRTSPPITTTSKAAARRCRKVVNRTLRSVWNDYQRQLASFRRHQRRTKFVYKRDLFEMTHAKIVQQHQLNNLLKILPNNDDPDRASAEMIDGINFQLKSRNGTIDQQSATNVVVTRDSSKLNGVLANTIMTNGSLFAV
jgi:hypothetical protein